MTTNTPRPTHRARIGRLVVAGTALGAMAVSGLAVAPAGAAKKQVTISAVKTPKNGTVLVGGRTTVYTLQPSATACTTACLKIWPAVMLAPGQTKPIAGHGVKASALSTMMANGGQQVTYNGKPLYWYYLDKKPGQVKGNFTDQWGKWTAVVVAKPSSGSGSGGSSTTGSGSGGSNSGGSAGTGGASF